MTKHSDNNSSRRKFLALSFLGGAGLLTQKGNAMIPVPEDTDTVPMLTPDGKLVEVPRQMLEQTGKRVKASNKDILKWSGATKDSKV